MQPTTKMMAIVACWASIGILQAQPTTSVQTDKPSAPASWIAQLDIDELDPVLPNSLDKIILMLHCDDVPRLQRRDYARRYLEGKYKYTRPYNPEYEETYTTLMLHALWELGRLNDTESISLLEEKQKQWELEQKQPLDQRTMAGFDPVVAEAVIARLKAVRDVPQVQSADDLIRRLEQMLHHIGFEGSIEAWQRELEKEVQKRQEMGFWYRGVHYWILKQYGQLILEASWNGVNTEPAYKTIQLHSAEDITAMFDAYVQLAKIPRERAAQWIVDDAMNWQKLAHREGHYIAALACMGTSVLPVVWAKLKWAGENRDQVKGTRMGIVALMELFVTLGGKQASPLVELFLNDENPWVREYACQAQDYIQQGKLFPLGPLF